MMPNYQEKFKQGWSTIPPLLIQQTITSLLKLLNTTKTTTHADENSGPGFRQVQKCVRGKTDLRKCDSYDIGKATCV